MLLSPLMIIFVLVAPALASAAGAETPSVGRQVSWWWVAEPTPDAMLGWVKSHRPVVSSLFMECGPAIGPTQDGGVGLVGAMAAGCVAALGPLKVHGVPTPACHCDPFPRHLAC